MTGLIDIVPYGPGLAGQFNHLWVTVFRGTTGNEPQKEDLDAVDHPEEFYIAQGGAVFFAVRHTDSVPVGVVAVKNLGNEDYEFCKLVVSEQARSSGAGRALVDRCIAFAREQAGNSLYLQTFHGLQAAVQMYHRMGFVDCPPPASMSVLARTDTIMQLSISRTNPA
jgi:GNAT superfamily N-acetyltransferase